MKQVHSTSGVYSPPMIMIIETRTKAPIVLQSSGGDGGGTVEPLTPVEKWWIY